MGSLKIQKLEYLENCYSIHGVAGYDTNSSLHVVGKIKVLKVSQ